MFVSTADVWASRERFLCTLSPSERRTFDALADIDKRRREWLAGRVAAKRAVQQRLGAPMSAVEIRAIQCGPTKGRPFAAVGGEPSSLSLSISHAADVAAAIVTRRPVGLDVEVIEARPHIEPLAFGPAERAAWADLRGADRDARVTMAWCEKEAIAKASGVGLRTSFAALDPRVHPEVRIESSTFVHRGCAMAWAVAKGAPRLFVSDGAPRLPTPTSGPGRMRQVSRTGRTKVEAA